MSYVRHEEKSEDGFFTLKIVQDDDPLNPRTDQDNLGRMVCFHSRYDLGDKDHYDLPEGFSYLFDDDGKRLDSEGRDKDGNFMNVICYVSGCGKFSEPSDAKMFLEVIEKGGGLVLPLYLYDHSGITMSTGSFSCPWDSGTVGFIYMLKETIDENWDGDEEKAKACLEAEVKEYDQFIRNDVWRYVVEDEDGETVDSCGGYFGDEYCEIEGKSVLKSMAEDAAKQRAADEKEENEHAAVESAAALEGMWEIRKE